MNEYIIYDAKSHEFIVKKLFRDETSVRHWIINHLDLSREYNVEMVEVA